MALSFNNSIKNISVLYVKLLNAKVSAASIKKSVEENPYYPSLLSLSDTFTRYNINNSAFNVSKEDFKSVQPPFVAFMNFAASGKDFVLVNSISDEIISYFYKSKKAVFATKAEFLQQYQDIIWIAEADTSSKEVEYSEKLKAEKIHKIKQITWWASFAVVIALFMTLNFSSGSILSPATLVILKFSGITVSILLLIYEVDKTNAFVKNICNGSAQMNCDAVLGSKASKIAGISWGEIGFFYFASTAIWLLFPGIPFSEKAGLLGIISVLASPYMLFSIYYQWKIVKQWCPLCLTIQAILFSELIWSVVFYWDSPVTFHFLSGHIPPLVISVLLPVLGWTAFKPVIKKGMDGELYQSAFRRLQNNPEIFNSLLQQQDKAAEGWQQLGISVGDTAASNTIIKVCNPYCDPCARAHPLLEEILAHNSDINMKIIFLANDRSAPVIRHLLAIADRQDEAVTKLALDDWYIGGQKNYDAFAARYPVNGEADMQEEKLGIMNKWCRDASITYTPTIFVNGFRLPENYSIEELKNIL